MSTRKKFVPEEVPAAAPKERGGIQSLERAFAILEEVARNRDGINLADLSKAVGLHNSTTFHLVRTMAQLGYISQVRDSKRYRIGSRIFTLAAGALEENSLLALATPVLETLTRETGETGHFAIRSGNDIVVIARTAGAGLLQMADRTGGQRPAHATALGKVLLAALSDDRIYQLVGPKPLRRFTPKTIVEGDALLREIEEVRRKGIAYDDGEFDAEIRCVAVPVHDFAGRVAGAIGISGAVWRLSLQSLHDKARLVREAARRLSAELGYEERKATRAA
ncbi:MAG TPA: IclR family transcriptional regulator [Burkholderiales bacterium]|nr:IclR family transcriptional regulator [Burkholderiales bacterium]